MLKQTPVATLAYAAERRLTEESGLEVIVQTDPQEYLPLAEAAGKVKTTPEMRAELSEFGASEPVFVSLMDGDRLAATVGVRCWDVDIPFIHFLNALYTPLYGEPSGAIETSPVPPIFRQIKGPACYSGEFFIAPAWRGQVCIGDLSILAYAEAFRRWDPEWIWGYVRELHARAGLSIRYHGATSYQRGVTWRVKNTYHRSSDRFVCSHREDLEWAFDRFLEDAANERSDVRRMTASAIPRPSFEPAALSS